MGATTATCGMGLDDRIRPEGSIGLEAFDDLTLDGPLQQLLDVAHKALLFGRDQRDGGALLTSATGAADSVHVVFGHHRQLEVHDVRK